MSPDVFLAANEENAACKQSAGHDRAKADRRYSRQPCQRSHLGISVSTFTVSVEQGTLLERLRVESCASLSLISATPSLSVTSFPRHNRRNFLSKPRQVLIESRTPPWNYRMDNLVLGLLLQVFLALGVAGLLWPDKLMPLFGVLLFPWRASYRLIRAHGVVAIGAYLIVLGKLLVFGH